MKATNDRFSYSTAQDWEKLRSSHQKMFQKINVPRTKCRIFSEKLFEAFRKSFLEEHQLRALREKCPNTEFFSGPCFLVFRLNTGKYGPEETLYLGTFHAVELLGRKTKSVKN